VAFREVSVAGIREVLRLWVRGYGLRAIARLSGVDRKTVRRYVEAAEAAGLAREHGEGALTDELIGDVVDRVRPARPSGHGLAGSEDRGDRRGSAAGCGSSLRHPRPLTAVRGHGCCFYPRISQRVRRYEDGARQGFAGFFVCWVAQG